MKGNNVSILSTRPLAAQAILKARAKNIELDVESFIETRSLITPVVSEGIQQLGVHDITAVFTSSNAAELVIECLRTNGLVPAWNIYCLRGTSYVTINDYFTENEINADASDATELAQLIINGAIGEVFFFCGDKRRDELPKILADAKIKVNEVVVYETVETPVKIEKKYSGILFYSPSAVKSFFSINNVDESTVLFALGSTTAHALKKYCKNKLLIGTVPNKEQLAKRAVDYFTS